MAYYYSPFRKEYNGPKRKGCPFCDRETINSQGVKTRDGHLVENDHYFWTVNWFPKWEGHTMVIPKRHVLSLDDETDDEAVSRHHLMVNAKNALVALYPGAGVEVFFQNGSGSESSVPHLHWHVVPSRPSDPIRGSGKFGRFTTTVPNEEKVLLYPTEIQLAREALQAGLRDVL